MYTFLLAIIYLAFISLGLPDSLLGAAWPVMQENFDVPISYVGFISMITSGATICSSLLAERLTKRFETRKVTVISVFLTAAALFGFSTVSELWMMCLWAVPYGLGAGAIDAALNNYVALHYNSRHMSWLHCFWGVGTIISPYIMSHALSYSVWNNGYRMVSFLQIGIAMVLLLTLPMWKVNQKKEAAHEEGKVLGIKGALQIKGVPFQVLGFLAYCAAESTAMLWASSYLAGTRNVEEKQAAAFAALFLTGITAGRFLSGFISDKLGDQNMIRLGAGIALCGVIGIVLPVDTNMAALAGFVIMGFGCAPVYPSIVHSTPGKFGADTSQAIIGIQMASAYVGATFMPPLFGLLANHISLKLLPYFLAFFFVLMIIMLEKADKTAEGRN